MIKLNGCNFFWLRMMTYWKNWYNIIWDKLSTDIKKEFDREPVYDKKFLKTKIESYDDEVTDFYYKEIPKVDSNHTCLAVISLYSTHKKDKNFYPEVFVKKCICI